MLRIGLDLRPTEVGFKEHLGRGTGRYTTELTRELYKLAREQNELELVPFGSDTLKGSVLRQFVKKYIPLGRATFDTQFYLPQALSMLDVELVHFFSHGDATARSTTPYVTTVLDLIPLRFAQLYRANKPNWRYYLARHLERQALFGAKGYLAISECTKRDMVELLGIEQERIFVTPLAASEPFYGQLSNRQELSEQQRLELLQKLCLDSQRDILLYVGGIDPRKNVQFSLEVFAELLKQSSEPRPQLVLAGGISGDDQYPALLRRINDLGISADVQLLGFVPDEQLVSLYKCSSVFVFPSLYEGFGLPVLEAMCCGLPVVAGANSSIEEIAAEAAVLLEDSKLDDWVSNIKELLDKPDRRLQLRDMGYRQAAKFSWRRTAELTLAAYRHILELDEETEVRSLANY